MQMSVAFSCKVQGTGASWGSWEDEASYTIVGRHQDPLLETAVGSCGLSSTSSRFRNRRMWLMDVGTFKPAGTLPGRLGFPGLL